MSELDLRSQKDAPPAHASPAQMLEALLDEHPDGVINAVTDRGLAMSVPSSIRLRGQTEPAITSGLSLFSAQDVPTLISMFERATAEGSAEATLHYATAPLVPVTVHVLDVRAEHGCFIGLTHSTTPSTAGSIVMRQLAVEPMLLRPRFGRLRRDAMSVIRSLDDAAAEMLGRSAADLVGQRLLDFIHPDERDLAAMSWMEMLSAPGLGRRNRMRCRLPDETWLWIEVTNHNLLDEPGKGYVLTDLVDVSEEMAAIEAGREREQLLQRIAETIPVGLLQLDLEQRVVYVNDRLLVLLDRPRQVDAEHQLAAVSVRDRSRLEVALADVLGHGRESTLDLRITTASEERNCQLALRALHDASGNVTGTIGCLSDTTQSVRLREELHTMATVDTLTGCLNRGAILQHLAHTLETPVAAGTAVVFLDLDAFKTINDEHGHVAGDNVLGVAAQRLHAALAAGQVLGRLGGDEFLVVCADVDHAGHALEEAERLRRALQGSVILADGGAVFLEGSAGVAWARTSTPDLLVEQADAAMYRAKSSSEHAVLYDPAATGPLEKRRVRVRRPSGTSTA